MEKDLYEVTNQKENQRVHADWIFNYVTAIRNYLNSIENHTKQSLNQGEILHSPYIFEKTEKAKDALEQIEYRTREYNKKIL